MLPMGSLRRWQACYNISNFSERKRLRAAAQTAEPGWVVVLQPPQPLSECHEFIP